MNKLVMTNEPSFFLRDLVMTNCKVDHKTFTPKVFKQKGAL